MPGTPRTPQWISRWRRGSRPGILCPLCWHERTWMYGLVGGTLRALRYPTKHQ